MKIISFNVNGIRATTKKTFIQDMQKIGADIICLQETKATVEQTKEAVQALQQYEVYGSEAERKGYSGTAILTKQKPINTFHEMGVDQHDKEGRITGAEFEKFYVISVYVPNSGSELVRLDYRQSWDRDFLAFLKELESKKPVIVCGDFNVAHRAIDLANPKQNYNKYAGYMQEEIDGMDAYLNQGFIDSFRKFHTDEVKYSWWSYRAGARTRNIGWRIDYALVSNSISNQIEDAFILNEVLGSDHCPIGIAIH